MARRTTRKRAQKARSVLYPWMVEEGHNRSQALLQKRLRLRQLQARYTALGHQVGESMSPDERVKVKESKGTYILDAAQLPDHVQEQLAEMMHVKAAIRELSAELGINWHDYGDPEPQEQLRIMGELLDGQHRSGVTDGHP